MVLKKQFRSEFQNGRNLGTCLCMWGVGSNGDSEAEGLAQGHKAQRNGNSGHFGSEYVLPTYSRLVNFL